MDSVSIALSCTQVNGEGPGSSKKARTSTQEAMGTICRIEATIIQISPVADNGDGENVVSTGSGGAFQCRRRRRGKVCCVSLGAATTLC